MNILNQIERNVAGAMSKGLPALQKIEQQTSPQLLDVIGRQLLEQTVAAESRQDAMNGMPDTTATVIDRKLGLPGASVMSPMSPGLQAQDKGMMQAQARQSAGLPQLAAPNMARMAGGGIVAFQEGGMPMSDAEAIAREMMVVKQQINSGNKSEEELRQLQVRLNELNTQMARDTTGNLRANVYQTMDRMQGREPDEGMYGGGTVKSYQTGDVVVGSDSSLPYIQFVARDRVTGKDLTADDVAVMRMLGQQDRIGPLSEDYVSLKERIFGGRVADALEGAVEGISEIGAESFEGREPSTDKSLLANLATILGAGLEATPGTALELIEGGAKSAYGLGEEIIEGADPERIVERNIPPEAKEAMRRRRLLSELRDEARAEGEYSGEEDSGMVDGQFYLDEAVKDVYRQGSEYIMPFLENILGERTGGGTSLSELREMFPIKEDRAVEDEEVIAPEATRDEDGNLQIEINKGEGEGGEGGDDTGGEGEGQKKKFNWGGLFDLMSKAGAGAGASAGFEGQKYLETRQAQDLAEELLGIETEQKRLQTFAELYPQFLAEAEMAWPAKEKELRAEKGEGFWASPTDFLTKTEREEIAAKRQSFIDNYIMTKAASMGLGGKDTLSETIQDFSNYSPS